MPEKTKTDRKDTCLYLSQGLMKRAKKAAQKQRWSTSVWTEEAIREKLERENTQEGGP